MTVLPDLSVHRFRTVQRQLQRIQSRIDQAGSSIGVDQRAVGRHTAPQGSRLGVTDDIHQILADCRFAAGDRDRLDTHGGAVVQHAGQLAGRQLRLMSPFLRDLRLLVVKRRSQGAHHAAQVTTIGDLQCDGPGRSAPPLAKHIGSVVVPRLERLVAQQGGRLEELWQDPPTDVLQGHGDFLCSLSDADDIIPHREQGRKSAGGRRAEPRPATREPPVPPFTRVCAACSGCAAGGATARPAAAEELLVELGDLWVFVRLAELSCPRPRGRWRRCGPGGRGCR